MNPSKAIKYPHTVIGLSSIERLKEKINGYELYAYCYKLHSITRERRIWKD